MNKMAKGRMVSKLVSIAVWITGILVSLAVGFGMTEGILTIPMIPEMITVVAGWIVIVLTVLSVILAIIENL